MTLFPCCAARPRPPAFLLLAAGPMAGQIPPLRGGLFSRHHFLHPCQLFSSSCFSRAASRSLSSTRRRSTRCREAINSSTSCRLVPATRAALAEEVVELPAGLHGAVERLPHHVQELRRPHELIAILGPCAEHRGADLPGGLRRVRLRAETTSLHHLRSQRGPQFRERLGPKRPAVRVLLIGNLRQVRCRSSSGREHAPRPWHGFAAADAQGSDAGLRAVVTHGAEQRGQNAAAAGADGVSQGDRRHRGRSSFRAGCLVLSSRPWAPPRTPR